MVYQAVLILVVFRLKSRVIPPKVGGHFLMSVCPTLPRPLRLGVVGFVPLAVTIHPSPDKASISEKEEEVGVEWGIKVSLICWKPVTGKRCYLVPCVLTPLYNKVFQSVCPSFCCHFEKTSLQIKAYYLP